MENHLQWMFTTKFFSFSQEYINTQISPAKQKFNFHSLFFRHHWQFQHEREMKEKEKKS